MSTNTAHNPITDRLAYKLAHYWAETHDTPLGPKAKAIREARLQGALEVAALWLGAPTPFAVWLTLQDSVNRHGQRPPFNPTNSRDRNDWYNTIVAEFVANWQVS